MSEDKDTKPRLGLSDVSAESRHEKLVVNEPLYPILKIEELPFGKDSPDIRSELPSSVSRELKPWQRVINIKEHEKVWPHQNLTPEEVVKRAARARHSSEIGRYGPTMSSVSLIEGRRSRYELPHGRDLMQAADDMRSIGRPQLAKTAAKYLAPRQGTRDEVYVPGRPFGQEKIGSMMLIELNEKDAVAQKFVRRLHWGPKIYFGSADAPINYGNLLADNENSEPGYLKNNFYNSYEPGHPEEQFTVAFDRSLHWAIENADDHQGLIAYKNPVIGGGMRNQGWRDSDTAMVHKDGEWADDRVGIAPIEIQGFLFNLYQNGARIKKDVYKDYRFAGELQERAWELQKTILDKGFVETKEGGFFASGFDWGPDGKLRPLEVATSAMGRLLTSDIFKLSNPETKEKLNLMIEKIFSPEMLTRWGIRTLAENEAAYVPFLYHVGPVWLHDSNEVARGLSNYGYFGLDRIIGALTTHQQQVTGVFYEHISGYDSEEPQVTNRDTSVYDTKHDVVYLFEQAPPPGQTWGASSEWAKHERYIAIPPHALEAEKLKFEKKIWQQLPGHIQGLVTLYERDLALKLSGLS